MGADRGIGQRRGRQPEPPEQGQAELVDEGCPEEFEVIGKGDVAGDADGTVVHARLLQPGRQCIADQQERQPRRQAEEQHDDGTGLRERSRYTAQPFVAGRSCSLAHSA